MNSAGEPKTFEESLDFILAQIKHVLLSKRHDYGKGNITKFGLYGILVRSSDKIERLINLGNSEKEPSNESIYDSWIDLAGYAVLALIYISGWFEKD